MRFFAQRTVHFKRVEEHERRLASAEMERFSKEQKLWFVAVGIERVIIICLALVFPCFGIEIPNWAAALMIIPMIIPVYERIQV